MRRLFALMVVAAFFIGACDSGGGGGESSEDPKQTLASAFEAMGEVDAQSVTISVASDPESLTTLSNGAVTQEQADLLLGSSITIEGTNTDDPASRAARVVFNVEGTDGIEIIVVGSDLYARVDAGGLVGAFGADEGALRTAIAQAEAQGLTFMRPLAEGEFVKFTGAADMGAAAGAPDTAQQEELLKQFGDALEEEATVTSEGSDDVGEHLVASLPLRDLYQRLLDLAPQTGQNLPPGLVPPAEEIPEGELTLDVWVADGRVAQIEFDVTQVGQFATQEGGEDPFEGVEQFALRVTLSDDVGEIAAPEAAAEVSAQELQALFGQLFFGASPGTAVPPEGGGGGGDLGGGGGGDVGLDCSIYEDLPPETFDGLPQETLDQLESFCPGVVPNN
jgi:hypothetical protein